MLDEILYYFINSSLLSTQQYGFRPKHSTEFAATNLVDHIAYKLDNGEILLNVYIDLSKIFGPHDIFFNNLEYYELKGVANRLIYSYISERQQVVSLTSVFQR